MWTNKSLSELTTFHRGCFVNWAAEYNLGTDSKPRLYTDDEANVMLSVMQFEIEDFESIKRSADYLEIAYKDARHEIYLSLD